MATVATAGHRRRPVAREKGGTGLNLRPVAAASATTMMLDARPSILEGCCCDYHQPCSAHCGRTHPPGTPSCRPTCRRGTALSPPSGPALAPPGASTARSRRRMADLDDAAWGLFALLPPLPCIHPPRMRYAYAVIPCGRRSSSTSGSKKQRLHAAAPPRRTDTFLTLPHPSGGGAGRGSSGEHPTCQLGVHPL